MTGERKIAVQDLCSVCQLTSQGRGAVATIAVEGHRAVDLISHFFVPLSNRVRQSFPIGIIVVGHWHSPTGAREEVVVCRKEERSFEVNCHGGFAASRAILDSLITAGATRISPEDWLRSKQLDAVQVAARLALAAAPTPRAAAVLLDQYRGALTRGVARIVQDLEASDPPFDRIHASLQRLVELSDVGIHLTTPWRVVVAGPSNVGKSSLVNALLGYDRAIVFDQPGTTRDILVGSTAIDGWPVELIDTAGLRHTPSSIEARGIELARQQLQACDLVLLVNEAIAPSDAFPEMLRALPPVSSNKILQVRSKSDLASGHRAVDDAAWTSVVTGEGLEPLLQRLIARLIPSPPEPGEAVPFTPDQVAVVRQAAEVCASSQNQDAIETCRRILARLSHIDP